MFSSKSPNWKSGEAAPTSASYSPATANVFAGTASPSASTTTLRTFFSSSLISSSNGTKSACTSTISASESLSV